jgi:hypothetical protein
MTPERRYSAIGNSIEHAAGWNFPARRPDADATAIEHTLDPPGEVLSIGWASAP